MKEIIIDTRTSGQRLDRFVHKYLGGAPKSFVQKMLRKHNIKLNDAKASGSEIVQAGDVVKLFLSDATIENFAVDKLINADAGALDIVFEDDNVLIVNKPAGVLSQPDSAYVRDSIADRAVAYLREHAVTGFTPAVANRLDRNTSGLVAIGKTNAAMAWLGGAFAENMCEKLYLTVVVGEVHKPFDVRVYISKNTHNTAVVTKHAAEGAKYASASFKPLASSGGYSKLRVKLETGRFHQIRASLKFAGYPIVGDAKYGDTRINQDFRRRFGLGNQLLHCESLTFNRTDGELGYLAGQKFIAEPPQMFQKIINSLGLSCTTL